LNELTSPSGALGLATAVLLLVLGHRLVRPARAHEWAAVAAYAAALVALVVGARGLAAAGAPPAAPAVRWTGAALLVAGLVLAGASARARLRAAAAGRAPEAPPRRARVAVHAGLALVLLGQLLRNPSTPGAIACGAAALVLGWAAVRGAAEPGRGAA
jgi:hypothetical protein